MPKTIRRSSDSSLHRLERAAEVAFHRDRNRAAGGLSRQWRYCTRLPRPWRILYASVLTIVVLAFVLKAIGVKFPTTARDGTQADLAGRTLSAASDDAIPDVKVDLSTFVRRKGAQLVLDDKPFYFAGFCNYYMLTRAADASGSGRKEVVRTFQQAQELGMTVLRFWAYSDGADKWNGLQPAAGMLDDNVFREGLDWMVTEARRYDMRLLLSLTNGYEGFGGMSQYVAWFGGKSITDFYTMPAIKAAFKKYIAALVTRQNSNSGVYYRDDPTILGWELANVPRNPGDDSGDVVQAWIDEMAAYIKSLDPNHLVMVGVTGWYGASSPKRLAFNPPADDVDHPMADWHYSYDAACQGMDFVRNQAGPDIDVMTMQLHPDTWLTCEEDCKRDWSIRWLRSHFEDATTLGKPLMISEFSRRQYGGMVQRSEFLETVYAEVEAWNAQHGNIAGTFLWMVATDTYPNYDAMTIYTTKRAASAPQERWPDLTVELLLQQQIRKEFLNWEATMKCMQRRAVEATAVQASQGWNLTLQLVAENARSFVATGLSLK